MRWNRWILVGFFGAVALLAWLLYPRERFMGYIVEGRADLARAETYYRRALESRPQQRFSQQRLAQLYERMGQPERAVPLYEQLVAAHPADWSLALQQLDLLERVGDPDRLQQARVATARRFRGARRVPAATIESLFYEAYRFARWRQQEAEAVAILTELIAVARDPAPFREEQVSWSRARGDVDVARAAAERAVAAQPDDDAARSELAAIVTLQEGRIAGRAVLEAGLARRPDAPVLLEAAVHLCQAGDDAACAVQYLERLLALGRNATADALIHDRRRTLAGLYLEVGRATDAMATARALIEIDPNDPRHWQLWLDALWSVHDHVGLRSGLERYLVNFPSDLIRERQLIELLLYEFKDATALPRYRSFVTRTSDRRIARDVAGLLMATRQWDAALAWLADTAALGAGAEWAQLRIECLERSGRRDAALAAMEQYVAQWPSDGMASRAVSLAAGLGERAAATRIATHWRRAIRDDDVEHLLEFGTALLWIDEASLAVDAFTDVLTARPLDPRGWFWRSEAWAAMGETTRARRDAYRVVELIGHTSDRQLARHWLASRARSGHTRGLTTAYAEEVKRWPHDIVLRVEQIEWLLTHDPTSAVPAIEQLAVDFPYARDRVIALRAEAAVRRRDWTAARAAWAELLQHNGPRLGTASWQRQAAMAAAGSRNWREAFRRLGPLAAAYPWRVHRELLQQWHRDFDQRIGPSWTWLQLGEDSALLGAVTSHHPLTAHWTLDGEAWVGRHRQASVATPTTAGAATLGATWFATPEAWLRARVQLGGGGPRAFVIAPLLDAEWTPTDRWRVAVGGSYGALVPELPSAIVQGAVRDRATAAIEWSPWRRLQLRVDYAFAHYRLPRGAAALGHDLTPGIFLRLTETPQLAIGYQFAFQQVGERDDFLRDVPLLPRVRTHYLSARLRQPLGTRGAATLGVLAGEDRARGLRLLRGELVGVEAGLDLRLLSWLDFTAAYAYGRETQSTAAGERHEVRTGLSGHWGNY